MCVVDVDVPSASLLANTRSGNLTSFIVPSLCRSLLMVSKQPPPQPPRIDDNVSSVNGRWCSWLLVTKVGILVYDNGKCFSPTMRCTHLFELLIKCEPSIPPSRLRSSAIFAQRGKQVAGNRAFETPWCLLKSEMKSKQQCIDFGVWRCEMTSKQYHGVDRVSSILIFQQAPLESVLQVLRARQNEAQ